MWFHVTVRSKGVGLITHMGKTILHALWRISETWAKHLLRMLVIVMAVPLTFYYGVTHTTILFPGCLCLHTAHAIITASCFYDFWHCHPYILNKYFSLHIGSDTLEVCTSWMSVTIWDNIVSPPTWVAFIIRAPFWLTVPPITWSSTPFAIGIDSPVIRASSTKDIPSITTPSTGIFSPGTTFNRSSHCSSSTGILCSLKMKNMLP